MENATHGEQAQCNNPKFLGKAGWVKKAPCRLLASYKDSYIHVDKTAVVIYEKEDLKNCIESLDLQNYDKCQELKSLFMRKHRLILIRSPKFGNKTHNIKFQVQTAEEKEAWIQALSDGINRAKNKVLDEVKTDESSHLQHLTRKRPKGNRNRRPPTRIHMKEVAELSSEGMLRLDLDLLEAAVANAAHDANFDDTDVARETNKSSVRHSTEEAENAHAQSQTELKVLKLPRERQESPPPSLSLPSSSSSERAGNSPLKQHSQPPTPPTKDKKPSFVPSESNQEAKRQAGSNEDKQQEQKDDDEARIPEQRDETLPRLGDDPTTCAEGFGSEDDKAKMDPQMPGPDTTRETPVLPRTPKKNHSQSSKLNTQLQEEDASPSQEGEDRAPWLQRPLPLPSLSSDVLMEEPTNCSQTFLPTAQANTRHSVCVDGCPRGNAQSDVSEGENAFPTSKTAGSQNDTCAGVLNISSDANSMRTAVAATTEVESKVSMCGEATPQSSKVGAGSFGDLRTHDISLPCRSEALMRNEVDLMTLENGLTLETSETNELMSSAGGDEARAAGELLTNAVEKFKKADHVLQEIKELKPTTSLTKGKNC